MEKIGRRTLELRVVEDKGSQIGEMEETNLTLRRQKEKRRICKNRGPIDPLFGLLG